MNRKFKENIQLTNKKKIKLDRNMNDVDVEIQAFAFYLEGYRTSIEILLSSVKNERKIIYPLIFLIVHYIEILIKDMNLNYGLSRGDFTLKDLKINSHNLIKLLDESKAEFIDYGVKDDEILDLENLLKYFISLSTINIISETMRYPIDLDNNLIISKDLILNLDNFNLNEFILKCNKILELTDDMYYIYNLNLHARYIELLSNLQSKLKK